MSATTHSRPFPICPPNPTFAEVQRQCAAWRKNGETIAFTNGCFDVLHEGHLELITEARCRADRLVIALNSDRWVAQHKGAGRPLQPATIRRAVAHNLSHADLTIEFDDETVEGLLAVIQPTIYLIGSDYREQDIIGRQYCGEIVFMDRLPGVSTTAKIANASQASSVLNHCVYMPFAGRGS